MRFMREKITGKANPSGLRLRSLILLAFFLSYLIVVVAACGAATSPPTPTPAPAPGPTPAPAPTPVPPTPDTAETGKAIFVGQACVGCHTIQGLPGAQGKVGPELTHFASNSLIVGIFPNTEENLKQYLKDPSAVKPGALMPNQNLTDSDIDALVAFLRTLK